MTSWKPMASALALRPGEGELHHLLQALQQGRFGPRHRLERRALGRHLGPLLGRWGEVGGVEKIRNLGETGLQTLANANLSAV